MKLKIIKKEDKIEMKIYLNYFKKPLMMLVKGIDNKCIYNIVKCY
jgi:hypothetical protein